MNYFNWILYTSIEGSVKSHKRLKDRRGKGMKRRPIDTFQRDNYSKCIELFGPEGFQVEYFENYAEAKRNRSVLCQLSPLTQRSQQCREENRSFEKPNWESRMFSDRIFVKTIIENIADKNISLDS
ncbi:hypothetical protein K0M31_008127 [Melipona bicolor]|uniref:Uncharacterized protein n=1 Tax=Melipona bicolor TaxID=60889 RepID=A0AA40FR29_9HYME|nr:hypothetical protein K0M31_008127 [Melipona bicolor]